MVRKLAYSVSEREHWISGVGGLLAILAVLWIGQRMLGGQEHLLIIASMGASAVLLFAAPHGALSQPWPVFGGHMVSALIGVACAHWLGSEPMLAAAFAVGLSIAAMYALRCLHPPGGATALYAVTGGTTVHALGYGYALNPVLSSVLIMLAVAVAYNYPFAWRRYPQTWAPARPVGEHMIPHGRLVYALSQIDTFVDISEQDLQRIYELAMHDEAKAGQAPAAPAAQSTRA